MLDSLSKDVIIASYTREEALADGQQVSLDRIDPKIRRDTGIKYPVFVTDSVMNLVDKYVNQYNKEMHEEIRKTIYWDIAFMFCFYVSKTNNPGDQMKFRVAFEKVKNNHTTSTCEEVTLISKVGAMDIDDPRPVITIMREMDI